MRGARRLYPSDEDWLMVHEPMPKAQFKRFHRHKQMFYSRVHSNMPKPHFQKKYAPKKSPKFQSIPYDYQVFNGYSGPRMGLTSSMFIWMPKLIN